VYGQLVCNQVGRGWRRSYSDCEVYKKEWSVFPSVLLGLVQVEGSQEDCYLNYGESKAESEGGLLGEEEGADAADYDLMFGGGADVYVGSYRNGFVGSNSVELMM
jgi:hypothetical protein